MAPDPTFAFVGGPCYPTLDFVHVFWIMITFDTMLTSPICIHAFSSVKRPHTIPTLQSAPSSFDLENNVIMIPDVKAKITNSDQSRKSQVKYKNKSWAITDPWTHQRWD